MGAIVAGGAAKRRLTSRDYTRLGDPAFYALPIDGEAGSADLVAREVGRVDRGHRLSWSVAAGSIYSVVLEGEDFRLARLDPATGSVEVIVSPPGFDDSMFSLSRDARRLIYSRIEQSESDLLFIDGAL